MARVVGDIAVKVGADVGPLQKQMKRGKRSMQDFERSTQQMAVNVAKAGAVMVTAMAAVGAGVLKMASEAAKAGVEIKNLSQVANTNTTTFQKMADASKTVGIEQQKLADILKDVNDKVGDFIVTGGGPMVDFFENIAPKVGVTADQFARLSGPEALQLYVTSLEQAGVSQQQMTFYMEAIASDATALIPLLRDNGAEMRRLGDEAERAGRILSEETVAGAAELDRELDELAQTLKTQATQAVIDHRVELIALANFITEKVIPAMAGLMDFVVQGVAGWRLLGQAAADAAKSIGDAVMLQGEYANGPNIVTGQTALPQGLPPNLQGPAPNDGLTQVFPMQEGVPLDPSGGLLPPMPMTNGVPLDPSDGLLPPVSATDSARMAWEATQELQEEIETGTADHADRLVEIEEQRIAREDALRKAAEAAKFRDISSAFGDLSSLMQSENEKLFKIGKAAAIAEATIDGYKAATSAWEKGMSIGGPPVAAAFTAASLAKTGMLISQIQSTSKNGGGSQSAGGTSSAATSATAEEPSITQNRSLTLIGDNFNRKQAIEIAEYINEGSDNGLIIR